MFMVFKMKSCYHSKSIISGKHDPFFTPPGAEAYKRDNPNAVVELLDTGHLALETHVGYIAQRIREVIGSNECN